MTNEQVARELAKELLFGKFQCAMIDYDKYPLDEATKKKLVHVIGILEAALASRALKEAKWWAERTSMWQRECRERIAALEQAAGKERT